MSLPVLNLFTPPSKGGQLPVILGDSIEIRFKFQRSVARIYCATGDDALLLTTGRPGIFL